MPSYKVLKPGFHGGKLYDPAGKRRVLHVDKEFPSKKKKEQVPSWLKPIPEGELSDEEIANEAAVQTEAAAQSVKDQESVDNATFMGAGEQANVVETL